MMLYGQVVFDPGVLLRHVVRDDRYPVCLVTTVAATTLNSATSARLRIIFEEFIELHRQLRFS